MAHLDLEERWLDLAEGTLSELEERSLRIHLDGCTACAKRYGDLRAAHLQSLEAGRLAASLEGVPVPSHIVRQVLAAARREARPPQERSLRRWALVALAATAAGVAFLSARSAPFFGASAGDPEGDREMSALLQSLAVTRSVRGPGDPVAEAAASAAKRWRACELTSRASTTRCAGVERRLEGLVDSTGAVHLIIERKGDRAALHLYGADGIEVGAVLFVGKGRREFLLPPLSEPAARALLRSPTCSDPTGVSP